MAKLGTCSRTAAVELAVQQGIIVLER